MQVRYRDDVESEGLKTDSFMTHQARMSNAWRTTPIKWYPIPILLGAIVLVGVKARRDWVNDQNESRGKVVDEDGKIVSMHGPWTVSNHLLVKITLEVDFIYFALTRSTYWELCL